jgi:hypothetical protein
MRAGWIPGAGAWRPDAGPLLVDSKVIWVAALLLALRDVPTGASLAKWLLGLRLETPDGRPLGLALRLARAPLSIVPVAWFVGEIGERRLWAVRHYVPSSRGLMVRALLALGAATWTVAWAVQSLRPSIGMADATRLAERTVAADPGLRRELGAPLDVEIRHIAPRSKLLLSGEANAEYDLRVTGSRKKQDMRVHARKVDGRWTVDEVVDIEISWLGTNGRDTLAVR